MADATKKAARKYDAVLAPSSYPKNKTGHARNLAIKAEFSKDFASPQVYWQHCGPDLILITPEPCPNRYQPTDHQDAGQDRFDWVDRGDGVMIGMLTDAARVTDEERAKSDLDARLAMTTDRQKQVQARILELEAEADRTEAENAELAKLKRFAAVMFGDVPKVPVVPAPASGAVPGPAAAGELKS